MYGRTVDSYTCNVYAVILAIAFPAVRFLEADFTVREKSMCKLQNSDISCGRNSFCSCRLAVQAACLAEQQRQNVLCRVKERPHYLKHMITCTHTRAQTGALWRTHWGFAAKCVRQAEERMCSLCLCVGGGCHVVLSVCVCVRTYMCVELKKKKERSSAMHMFECSPLGFKRI